MIKIIICKFKIIHHVLPRQLGLRQAGVIMCSKTALCDSLLVALLREKYNCQHLIQTACAVVVRLHNTKGHWFYKKCKRKNYRHHMASQQKWNLLTLYRSPEEISWMKKPVLIAWAQSFCSPGLGHWRIKDSQF